LTGKSRCDSLSSFAENRGRKSEDECEEVSASERFCSRRSRGRRYPGREPAGASSVMTIEAERPEGLENPEKPNIVNATVLIDEQEVLIPTVDGRAYREGKGPQLGKRFICAQEIVTETSREVTDSATNKTTIVATKKTQYLSGSIKDVNGNSIYLGCGTETMCIKPSKDVLASCGIPMTLLQPQVLPSAD